MMENCGFSFNETFADCTVSAANKEILNKSFSLNEWNDEYSQKVMLNSAILIGFLVIGVIGNITVIVIYSIRMKNIIADRYFIPILAFVDLLAVCLSAALNLARNFRQFTFPGNTACKFLIYVAYFLSFSSLNLLLIIAVHRFLKVCRPFRRKMTLFWKRLAVGICILFTAVFQSPIITFYGTISVRHPTLNITGSQCNKLPDPETHRSLEMYQPFDIVLNSGLIVCITILYGIIGRTIYKKTNLLKKTIQGKSHETSQANTSCDYATESTDPFKEETSQQQSIDVSYTAEIEIPVKDALGDQENIDNEIKVINKGEISEEQTKIETDNAQKQSRLKLTKKVRSHFRVFRFTYMFMLISFLAFLSYLPTTVLISLESRNDNFWEGLSQTKLQLFLLLRRLYMLNNIINPFVYGLFDTRFRQEFYKLIGIWKRVQCNTAAKKR